MIMNSKNRFTEKIIATIHYEKILGIRAGRDSTHRVIGIWAVVGEKRVFVRSWSTKPRGWWRTFLDDPHGSIIVGDKEKRNMQGSVQFVKDMSCKKSRDTTMELVQL